MAHFTDSYSESSYLAQWGLGRFHPSLSVSNDNFTDSYSESSCLAGQILTDLPPSPTGISQIPTLRAHIWQTRSWQIFHPHQTVQCHRFLLWGLIFGRPGLGRSTSKWQFTDSYSEVSYLATRSLADLPPQMAILQIPTLLIFGRPGLGRSTPSLTVSNDNFTDSYSESSCLASEILTDLPPSCTGISQIPTLRAHIWQTRSWQIFQPPPNSDFTDSYSDSSYLTHQVLRSWQIYPLNGNFTDSYSKSSYLADQVLEFYPLKWQFHRFLLWELHIWQTRSWQIFHPHKTVISQIPTLRAHIWQTRSWQIHSPRDFTDSYSMSSQTRSWEIYPPQMAISQIPNLRAYVW